VGRLGYNAFVVYLGQFSGFTKRLLTIQSADKVLYSYAQLLCTLWYDDCDFNTSFISTLLLMHIHVHDKSFFQHTIIGIVNSTVENVIARVIALVRCEIARGEPEFYLRYQC